jgi:FAD-linked sulfhydryl oxidase
MFAAFAPFDAAFAVPTLTTTTGNNNNSDTGTGRRDNVQPQVWGPSMWKLMHVIALTYPDHPTRQDMRDFATFFTSLQNVLPCEGCRKGYARLIGGRYPLSSGVLSSRASLFNWTVDVHNAVNEKVGKRVDANYRKWFAHYKNLSA